MACCNKQLPEETVGDIRASENIDEDKLLLELWTKIQECDDIDIKKHIKLVTDDELMLLIRTRKYDVERAFSTLNDLVKHRKRSDIFNNLLPSRFQKSVMRLGIGTFKDRDVEGRRTIYVRACDWHVKEQSLEDLVISAILIGFEMLRNKDVQLKGINILVDCKGFSFTHARQVTPSIIQKYVDFIIHTTPIKIKKVQLVNMSSIVGISLNLVKMFLPAKIRKRLIIHKSMSTLEDVYTKDMIPDWIGGLKEESEIKDFDLIKSLLSPERESWFQELGSYEAS